MYGRRSDPLLLMRGHSYRAAFGGVLSAAAVAVMFFGSVVPFATVACPAAASLSVLYFVLEYNKRFAFTVYLAIALISVFLIPDKEAAFLFIAVFGHYPLLKSVFERFRGKALGWALKFLLLNAGTLLLYWLLAGLFAFEALRAELAAYTPPLLAALLAAFNLVFLVYDVALTRLVTVYLYSVRPKVFKNRPGG